METIRMRWIGVGSVRTEEGVRHTGEEFNASPTWAKRFERHIGLGNLEVVQAAQMKTNEVKDAGENEVDIDPADVRKRR